jgi:hypothetical protein
VRLYRDLDGLAIEDQRVTAGREIQTGACESREGAVASRPELDVLVQPSCRAGTRRRLK